MLAAASPGSSSVSREADCAGCSGPSREGEDRPSELRSLAVVDSFLGWGKPSAAVGNPFRKAFRQSKSASTASRMPAAQTFCDEPRKNSWRNQRQRISNSVKENMQSENITAEKNTISQSDIHTASFKECILKLPCSKKL